LLPTLLVVVALPILTKFDNGFIYDDVPMIVESGFIHDPANLGAVFLHHTLIADDDTVTRAVDTYRPVTLLTFFWDAWVSGKDPFSYHLTNLLLHLTCVALVFFFATRLFGDRRWAAVTALFFGLSPWTGEAHVWINGRSDPMGTMFGLAALLLFSHALELRGARRISALALAASSFLLGLFSKEVVLLLLPALFMLPGLSNPALGWRERAKLGSGFLLVAALYLAARTMALSGMRALTDDRQLTLALGRVSVLLLDGALHLVVPSPPYLRSLVEDYDPLGAPLLIAAVLVVLATTWLAFRVRHRAPLVGFGLAIFAPTLAPAAVIATMAWGGFGRYLYLPAVGLGIALAAVLRALSGRLSARHRRLASVGLVGYLLALGFVLALSVGTFRDQETYCQNAIRGAPDHALGYGILGAERERERRFDEAETLYAQAFARDPSRPKYVVALATILLARGDMARARALAESALGRLPRGGRSDLHAILIGTAYTDAPEVAVQHLRECLEEHPEHEGCRRWAHALQTEPSLAAHYRPLLTEAAATSPRFSTVLAEVATP
jgi:tetratricopeptide (TPR) repeat protein